MGAHDMSRPNTFSRAGVRPVVPYQAQFLACILAGAVVLTCCLFCAAFAEPPNAPESKSAEPSRPSDDATGGEKPRTDAAKESPEPPDEIARLKLQIVKTQNESPLGFRKRILCSAVQGYGLYSPLKAGVPTSNLILYVEPANYGTMAGSDRFVIDCVVDIAVVGNGGKVLYEKKGKLNYVSRSPILDVFYAVGIQLKKPLEKTVTIKMILHDNIKNERASTALTLTLNPGHGV
jgi:hypothetical protein